MTTYKHSGVDVKKGDECSALAYKAARSTFSVRKGMIGEPVVLKGGFTGALDMGSYYLVQNCDGVGTKSEVARLVGRYDTLGYDLVAMVADDAVCVGAEVISLVNTIDMTRVDASVTAELMKGLARVCREQRIVIPGGEIGELSSLVNGMIWNATALGIVEKSRFITGSAILNGDSIVGLLSNGFRSNGFTLIRHILQKKYGAAWHKRRSHARQTWGDAVLTPSLVYHRCVLDMIGGFKKRRRVDMHGIVHVTGGGIYNNIARILPKGLKASFDNLPPIPSAMRALMDIGNVNESEAYKTWNMGLGMLLICPSKEIGKIEKIAKQHRIKVRVVGGIS